MANIDFFSTETITVPISFRLFAIALRLNRKQSEKYSAKLDQGFMLMPDYGRIPIIMNYCQSDFIGMRSLTEAQTYEAYHEPTAGLIKHTQGAMISSLQPFCIEVTLLINLLKK